MTMAICVLLLSIPKPGTVGPAVLKEASARLGTNRTPHFRELRDLQYSPDGRIVVARSHPGFMHAWDAATGRKLWTFPKPPPDLDQSGMPTKTPLAAEVLAVQFPVAGVVQVIASPGVERPKANAEFITLDRRTGGELSRKPLKPAASWQSTFSPDGTLVGELTVAHKEVTTQPDRVRKAWLALPEPVGPYTIRVADAVTGEVRATIKTEIVAPQWGGLGLFSPDGRYAVVFVAEKQDHNDAIHVYDLKTGRQAWQVRATDNARERGWIESAVFCAQGRRLVVVQYWPEQVVTIFETATGKVIRRVHPPRGAWPEAVAASLDGTRLVMRHGQYGYGDPPPTISCRDLTTGGELFRVRDFDAITITSFAPDGKTFTAATKKGTLLTFDAKTGVLR